jgi:hypothetical protein
MNDEGRSLFIAHRSSFIVLLFLIPRAALLVWRQPFFDERFTRWISAKSLGGILDALHFDSGPPLYYWLLRLLGNPPLPVARGISLLFATVGILAILLARRLGEIRFAAAALIAVFPPAVLYSVDARAYALCAMFVSLGLVGPGVPAPVFPPPPHSCSARIATTTARCFWCCSFLTSGRSLPRSSSTCPRSGWRSTSRAKRSVG